MVEPARSAEVQENEILKIINNSVLMYSFCYF